MTKFKFSLHVDYGYSSRFDLDHLIPFEMDILAFELINHTDPKTAFRIFVGGQPSYESQPLTSITGKTIRDNMKSFYGHDYAANTDAIGLTTYGVAFPIMTLDGKSGEDCKHDTHLCVTFLINAPTPEEALERVKPLLSRSRSPFVRKIIHYVNWGTPEETEVIFQGDVRPPATQGPCY